MLKYIAKRIGQSLITLIIVVTLAFSLMRLLPVDGYYGERADKLNEQQRMAILDSMGLNDPLYIQIKDFYVELLHGDLGHSTVYRPKVPVTKVLATKIPYSLAFGLGSIGISLVCGVSMGILMARFKGKFWDKLGTGYILVINAVPAVVYYLFIQLYATDILHLPMFFSVSDPKTWILPLISMSLGNTASYAMWMRRYMVDELNKDYIRLARAKGMKNSAVMVKHVMRNAFVPMAQYLPASILYTVAGSIYIESLYSIPGMGGLLVDCIQRQDNPIVQALVLIFAAIGIIGLLLGDIAMAACDPRIKLDKKGGAR